MAKTLTASGRNIPVIIREKVVEVMREILSDPDAGLELTAPFIRRLKRSLKNKKEGKVEPLAKVLKQYGM